MGKNHCLRITGRHTVVRAALATCKCLLKLELYYKGKYVRHSTFFAPLRNQRNVSFNQPKKCSNILAKNRPIFRKIMKYFNHIGKYDTFL